MNQSKEDMLDNFLGDLFANNLDTKKMGLGNLPLDKSMIMQTAKKQQMDNLLQTDSAGHMLSNMHIMANSA